MTTNIILIILFIVFLVGYIIIRRYRKQLEQKELEEANLDKKISDENT